MAHPVGLHQLGLSTRLVNNSFNVLFRNAFQCSSPEFAHYISDWNNFLTPDIGQIKNGGGLGGWVDFRVYCNLKDFILLYNI